MVFRQFRLLLVLIALTACGRQNAAAPTADEVRVAIEAYYANESSPSDVDGGTNYWLESCTVNRVSAGAADTFLANGLLSLTVSNGSAYPARYDNGAFNAAFVFDEGILGIGGKGWQVAKLALANEPVREIKPPTPNPE